MGDQLDEEAASFSARGLKKGEFRLGADLSAAIVHGAGFLLSIVALVVMVVYASSKKSAAMVVAVSLWGAALVYRFLFSTLAHALRRTASAKIFRTLDHTGEYFIVASSFAPLCLSPHSGFVAYLTFGLLWVAAVYGVIFSSVYFGRFRSLPLILVVALAWLAALVLPEIRVKTGSAYFWIIGGWFAYLVGTIFYSNEESAPAHLAWHSISLAACVSLFFGIFPYLGVAY